MSDPDPDARFDPDDEDRIGASGASDDFLILSAARRAERLKAEANALREMARRWI